MAAEVAFPELHGKEAGGNVMRMVFRDEEFATWWSRRHVGDLSPAFMRFIDSVLGELRFTGGFFQPTGGAGRILTVFMGMPILGSGSARLLLIVRSVGKSNR
ncbi:hypothetical protein DKQ62_10050 [Halomonas elongata]|uniref:hypothetical protein n=1 Tax=Halomonas elongata TaxID=2746 RepID=UPI000DCBC929|nr:hypothetical protein [Halomonas elongata]RAW07119.1 hypothetical protein DKQ62_10050 [Halomonas elongata]